MTRRQLSLLMTSGAVIALAVVPRQAVAGVYTVALCAADRTHYSTDAFNLFATRGMRIVKGCDPSGNGLIVGNTVSRGRTVKRGAAAQVSLDAPAGTHFLAYHQVGWPKRSDCRYAIRIWAEAPGTIIPMYNRRANQNCPHPGRAQAAKAAKRDYGVDG